MAQGPPDAGAYVVDVADGRVVFDDRSQRQLFSASVMKLYTTSTALMRLGTEARLSTRVLGTGRRAGTTWRGDLYLRGGGDFTFGSASFARRAYGSGGTVEALAAGLRRSGIRQIRGSVLGDESLFSDNGGPDFDLVLCPNPLFGPGCPYGPAGALERPIPNGPRGPVSFNRGLVNGRSAKAQRDPARFAAAELIRTLRRRGIRVTGRAGARRTPRRARTLASTRSSQVAQLVKLINRPSDNYAAETLFRVLGARLAGAGSRAGGARAVAREIRGRFGLRPRVHTGSGETLFDRTSPREVVGLLTAMRRRPEGASFERSLSIAGRSGTLLRYRGTVAEERCKMKDGTRTGEPPNTTLNQVGYCRSVGGRTFAFAIMMNGIPVEFVPPDQIVSPAYALEDRMVEVLAGYGG